MNEADLVDGHGGRIDAMSRAFPQAPLPWLDLSTGINPLAYPFPDLPRDVWTRLPTAALRQSCEAAMATAFACNPAACRAVAGTELAIRHLPALLGSRTVAVRAPSYADHATSWRKAGARVLTMTDPLTATGEADAVVVVNPNNPDGHRWSVEQLDAARRELEGRGGWLIVDEAYAELDPARSVAGLAGAGGLIVLRSFGKFFGLAGIRLGAVLAPPEFLQRLHEMLGEWDVSGPALAAGTRVYGDTGWQDDMRRRLADEARDLVAVLRGAGLDDIGGTDLFRYVRVGSAPALWRQLAERGIAVRRFAEDAHHLRIGLPGSAETLDRLAEAL